MELFFVISGPVFLVGIFHKVYSPFISENSY